MPAVSRLFFLDPSRLFVQESGAWNVVLWPSGTIISEGRGTGCVDQGEVVASVTPHGLDLGGHLITVQLPTDERVHAYGYSRGRDILLVAGTSKVGGGRMPGPSLLPIPSEGSTAQEFGTYPAEGPSLWTLNPDSGATRCMLRVSGIEEIRNPSHVGRDLVVYEHSSLPLYGASSRSRLRVVLLATGESEDFLPNIEGVTTHFVPSPNGRDGALLHSNLGTGSYPFWYRMVVRRADGEICDPLPGTLRLTGEAPAWSPDGRFVAVTAFQGIQVGVLRVTVPGTGSVGWEWTWMGSLKGTYRHPAVHPDGSVVATWQEPGRTPGLVHLTSGQEPQAWAVGGAVSDAVADPASGPNYQRVCWSHGPSILEGVYVAPQGSRHLPLVVDLHGGPINGLRYEPQPRWVHWCQQGYAVFAPDYRGSGILGQEEMLRTVSGADGAVEDVCEDVLTGVDWLIGHGLADEDRLVLFGHSAGATLVHHLLTYTARFRAAVAWEGHADETLDFYLAWGGGGLAFARHAYGGSPLTVPDVFARQSPSSHVHRIKTPVLLLHGDDQTAHAIQWYTMLRESGVLTELVFYRGEGHTLQRPENQQDLFDRSTRWFARWLKDGQASTSQVP